MGTVNLMAGWIGVLLGFIAGAVPGLMFHRDEWLGGYGSWRRRMIRLGHISFFGLAGVNFAYAFTVPTLDVESLSAWPGPLFIAGAIAMPLVCYLSALDKRLRHIFPIPVVCLIAGALIFIFGDLLP